MPKQTYRFLHFVRSNLVGQANPSPLLMEVDDHTTVTVFSHVVHGLLQLLSTVTFQGSQHLQTDKWDCLALEPAATSCMPDPIQCRPNHFGWYLERDGSTAPNTRAKLHVHLMFLGSNECQVSL